MRKRLPRRGPARRLAAILFLIAALSPAVWLHSEPVELEGRANLRFVEVDTDTVDPRKLGPFALEKAWRVEATPRTDSGFSALVALGGGRLLAMSDGGVTLEFSVPDAERRKPPIGGTVFKGEESKHVRDVEAATADLEAGIVWLAVEHLNWIVRFDYRDGRLVGGRRVAPRAMRDWGSNSGPESLVRLGDGSFLALREGFTGLLERRRHAAVRFPADPVERPKDAELFTFVGPHGYSPTDAALLPDGRVLILLRRVVWPMPPRFGGAIAIGDPALIREGSDWRVRTLATWRGGMPVDNLEAMAVEPGAVDGPLTIWLLSDDNRADLQTTVLWKLRLDMERLPPRKQKDAQ
jgi:hypothetical protein